MYMDEIQDLYLQVFYAMVIVLVEVFGYIVILAISDAPKMVVESIHESQLSLSHVLHPACFACDAINEVVTSTSHVVFCSVFSPCVVAFDLATLVQ